MSNYPLVIERVFDASVSKVWEALTINDLMKKWYFVLPDFKAEVGFEFTFTGGADDQHMYTHLCRIIEVVPYKKLAYSWRYEGYPGYSTVSFELFDNDGKTRVILTHTGLDSFEHINPDFAKKNFELGWASIMDHSLKTYVESEMVKQSGSMMQNE